MKTFAIGLLALGTISTSAFAMDLKCKSASYEIQVGDITGNAWANYAINGKMNEGADVSIGSIYFSDRIVALSLTVDGQPAKFELSVIRGKDKQVKGTIFTGNSAQAAICTLK